VQSGNGVIIFHALTAPLPPPWSIDEHEECFIVRDASG
jgi:hypothetical protein